MRLRMTRRSVVDGRMRGVGEVLDPDQLEGMLWLCSGVAVPADPGELTTWRDGLPRPRRWLSWWRG